MYRKHNALITPKDVAPLLGLSPQAVRIQMQNGKLPIGIVTEGKNGGKRYTVLPDRFYAVTGIKLDGYEPDIKDVNYKMLAVAIVDEIAKRIKEA